MLHLLELQLEYFRDTGRPALIIYDDFVKASCGLSRSITFTSSPTRPRSISWGRILSSFQIIERAAKVIKDDQIAKGMNDLPESIKDKVKGGGSLTALPIIETQAGDVSAYIPTNVISITDGQIFLESDLFQFWSSPCN